MSDGNPSRGYTCKCGSWWGFTPWANAHWDIPITHTCETCKRQNILVRGKIIRSIKPFAPTTYVKPKATPEVVKPNQPRKRRR